MINAYGITVRSAYIRHEDTVRFPCATTVAVGQLVKHATATDDVVPASDTTDKCVGIVVEINNAIATILTKFQCEINVSKALDGMFVAGAVSAAGTASSALNQYEFSPTADLYLSHSSVVHYLPGYILSSASAADIDVPVYFDFIANWNSTMIGSATA